MIKQPKGIIFFLIFTIFLNILIPPAAFAQNVSPGSVQVLPLKTLPRAGQAGVFPDSDIIITFNQAVKKGAGFSFIRVTDPAGKSVPVTCGVWGDTLTIKPENPLAYDTVYTVTLPATSILNAGGWLTTSYTFSFTTKFAVTDTNPVDQAAGVSINTPVTATFSNIVKAGSSFNRISLYQADNPGTPVPLTAVQLSGTDSNTRTKMTLTYQGALAPATNYVVKIPAGAVEDQAGHRLDADYSFQFKTHSNSALPQVYSSEPLGGAKDISPNQVLSVTFNDDIVPGPNYDAVAVTVSQSGAAVAVTKEIVSDQLVITPAAPLSYTTTYAVSIPAGAVADAVYGDWLKEPYNFTFTTAKPLLAGTSPANGESGVYIDAAPALFFNQPVTGAQLDAVVLRDSGGNQVPVKGILDGDILVMVPSQLLKPTTNTWVPEKYTVEVPAGTVLTRDGTPNDSYSFSFTTRSSQWGWNTAMVPHGPDYFFPQWASPSQGVPYPFTGEYIFNAKKYMWDFGDGDTATGWQEVSHTYANVGHYTVTMLVKQEMWPGPWNYYAASQSFDVKPAPPPPPPPPPPFNPETATLTVDTRWHRDTLPGGAYPVAPGEELEYELRLSDGAASTGWQEIELYVGWNNQNWKLWGTATTDRYGKASFTGVMPSWVGAGSGYTVYFKMVVGGKIKATSSMTVPGTSNITGYVRLHMVTGANTGPPAGTTVELDGGIDTVTVSSEGSYWFNNVTTGTHRLKVSAPGWETAESTVSVGANQVAGYTFGLEKGDPSSGPAPVIRSISWGGTPISKDKPLYFLRDLKAYAGFDSFGYFSADVDWKGHYPGYVKMVINSSPPTVLHTFRADPESGSCEQPFTTMKNLVPGQIEVYAISGEGFRSEAVPMGVSVSLNDLPGGLKASNDLYDLLRFRYDSKGQYTIPVTPNLSSFITPVIGEIPVISGLPAVLGGGQTEGTAVLGPGGLVVTVPDQPGMTAGELGDIVTMEKYGTLAYKGFKKLAGKKSPARVGMLLIEFSRSVVDKYTFDPNTGGWVQDSGLSNFITDVEGYYSRSYVPFKDGTVKKMFSKYGASMDLTFTLTAQMNNITETKLLNGALVDVGGQIAVQIPLAEIDGGVSAAYGAASGYLYVSLTGDSVIVWNQPDGPTRYYLDLVGGAKVSLGWGAYSNKWDFLEYKWGDPLTYSGGKWMAMSQALSLPSGEDEPQDSESPELTPASRDYLTHRSGWLPAPANPAAQGNPAAAPRMIMAVNPADVPAAVYDGAAVTPLQYGIFPESAQDVISTGNGAFMVLLLDNPAHDAMNRTQVNYSAFDGSAWSEPQSVTPADSTGDFNPVAARVEPDTLSAAWINLKPGITDSTSPSEFMSSTEIAVSNYNTATRQWGTVQKLVYGTDPVNLMPTIAGGSNKGLLVWVTAPEVSGAVPSGSESIVASRYDGSTWSVPEAVYSGFSGIVSTSLAYNTDGTGIYAFSVSSGEEPGLANEIYIMKYDGTNWGSPIEVSNNAEVNANPQVAYVDGRPLLVWWSDGQIVYCDDLDTLTVRTAEAGGTIGQDFTLAQSDSLHLVEVVGAGKSSKGRDIYTMPYDAAAGLWGSPAKLAAAGALLRSPSAAFAGGHLVTVYDKDNLVQAVSDSGKAYQTVGDTDLYAADLPVVHKLSVPAGGLSVLQGNVMPGGLATISAQVYNTGFFTENNITVGFYDGDPGDGGEAIGSATISGPLAPGAGAAVQLDWLVPLGQTTHQVYVVADPLHEIPNADRSSSAASLPVVLPDLSLQLNYDEMSAGDYVVTAEVTNTGGFDITGATLSLSALNHTTGSLDVIAAKPLDLGLGYSSQIPVLWQAAADYIDQGEAVIFGEINPPAGAGFYSGDSIQDALVIPVESLNVTAFPPVDNIAVGNALVLKFNDVITPGAGTVTLTTTGGTPAAITTGMAGNVLTITPQVPLAYDTGYTLTVPANAVAGQVGGTLAADFVRSFTTEGSTPAMLVNNLSDIPVAGTLTIPFTGPIQPGAAFSTINLLDAAQKPVAQTSSVSANILTIEYSGLACGAAYTVDIPAGALASGQGEPLTGQTLTLQTAAAADQKAEMPTATPPGGSTVANNSTVTLADATAGAAIYYTTDGSTPTTGSASGTSVTISGYPGQQVTVRALAAAEGYADSEIASFSYMIEVDGSGVDVQPAPAAADSTSGAASVSPAAGGTVSLSGSAKLVIPPGALEGTSNAAVAIQAAVSPPENPPGFSIHGQVYRFTVNGQDHYTFKRPVNLTLAFDPARVPAGETPTVGYYDYTAGRWVDLGGTVDGNRISVQVDHFTEFAVLTKKSLQQFIDITGTWAQDSISKLAAQGAINGYPDGTFRPNSLITRAEFVTVVLKALKLAPKDGPVFADTRGTWAQNFVSTAAAYGIVNGYDASRFGPNDPLTREQMTAMVVKASQAGSVAQPIPGGETASGTLPFQDAALIAVWARDYVASGVKSGLVKGYRDGSFRPLAHATRAEAVTLVMRVVEPQTGSTTAAVAAGSGNKGGTAGDLARDLARIASVSQGQRLPSHIVRPGIARAAAASAEQPDRYQQAGSGANSLPGYLYTAAGDYNSYGTTGGYGGDGSTAAAAGLKGPAGVARDTDGNIYIADSANHVIREVAASDHTQWGIAMQAGHIYTVAGSGNAGYSGDGSPAAAAELNYPTGIAVDADGNLYIADLYNNVIRQVAASDHTQWGIAMQAGYIYTVAGRYNQLGGGYSGDGAGAAAAELNYPAGVAADAAGNLYIADMGNSVIRQVAGTDHTQWGIAMQAGNIYTIAGDYARYGAAGGYGGDGGPATAAGLSYPNSVAVDTEGNLYIADSNNNVIREVAARDGSQRGIAMQAGAIYTVAGHQATGGSYGGDGGPAAAAALNYPNGVAVDVNGNLYVADSSNNVIREVAARDGNQWGQGLTVGYIYTVAGDQAAGGTYSGDRGSAAAAGLNWPAAVAVDPGGSLYLADMMNNVIRVSRCMDVAVAASPAKPAAGSTTSITVTVRDGLGNPVGGQTVDLTGDGSAQITTVQGTTQDSGIASFSVTDAQAETVTLTARVGTLPAGIVQVEFWGIQITSSPAAGEELTAVLAPTVATATYQWQVADSLTGQYTDIAGATGSTYTPAAADFGRYLRVVAAGTGTYTGSTTSAAAGPVAAQALTGIGEVSGTPRVGDVLTAGTLSPTVATAAYQWQVADSISGPFVSIAGATASTYTPVAADYDRYLKIEATGTGAYTGSLTSAAVGPVAAQALTGIEAISGTLQVGSVLTAGALAPAGATAAYQWQEAQSPSGPYMDIAGATESSYTVAAAVYGRYIKVAAAGTGAYTGSVTSAAVGPAAAQDLTGTGAVSGTPQVGAVLTAGTLTPAGATATYQWQVADSLSGPYVDIAGATEGSYTVAAAVYGRYLKIIATGTGAYTGSVTSAAVGPVAAQALTGIEAISGTPQVGSVLTAGSLTPAGATATYQWQEAESPSGQYVDIAGATGNTYTPVAAGYGRYLRITATGNGAYSGTVVSAAVGPVAAQALTGIGAIGGTPQVGAVLMAGTLTPAGATAAYQWQEADSPSGPYLDIAGAAESSYTVEAAVYGRYLKVVATGTGAFTGSVNSAAVGPVAAQELTGIKAISGTPQVGSVLTAGALTPAEAAASYQWQVADSSAGPYADIIGAIESSYKVAAADYSRYLRVVAAGTGAYAGSVTSTAIGPVTAQPLTAVVVSGTPYVGAALAAVPAPAGAAITCQWQAAADASGPYSDLDGATGSSYIPQMADTNRYLRVVAAGTGGYTGSVTSAAAGPVSPWAMALETAPTAAPGTTPATTVITASPNTAGNTLVVRVSSAGIAAPHTGDAAPSGGGVINPYIPGTNLSGVFTGDYVGVYELNGSGQVVAFSQIRLTGGDIQPPPGYIYLAAGLKGVSGLGDAGDYHYVGIGGPATNAGLEFPGGVAFDVYGNLYISSTYQHVIDVIPAADGMLWGQDMQAGHIYTVAGNYALTGGLAPLYPTVNGGYSGDGGPATDAWLNTPGGLAFDGDGNMYFADTWNNLVRMVAAYDHTQWGIAMQAGHIYTVAGDVAQAGSGGYGAAYSGDGGPATAAELAFPSGVAIDNEGNLYIADSGNNVVRMVAAGDQTKWGQAMQAGYIYTVAGQYLLNFNGVATGGYSGDGGAATAAELTEPWGVAVDPAGNLYIADAGNDVVREVAARDGTQWGQDMQAGHIYTVVGDYYFTNQPEWWNLGLGDGGPAAAALLDYPAGIALDADGNLYIIDQQDLAIREVAAGDHTQWGQDMQEGHIYSVAGDQNTSGWGNRGDGGPAPAAGLNGVGALALNSSGDIYIGTGGNYVRTITVIDTAASSVAASPDALGVGESASITVTLKDAVGNPLSGRPVVLTADGGSSTITPLNTITQGNGTAVFSVSDSQTETVTYTVMAGTLPVGTVQVTFWGTIPLSGMGAISGTPQVGSVLTAGALTPGGAAATYQWEQAPTADGLYTAIAGATGSSYTVAAAVYGQYLRVVASASGEYSGRLISTAVGPVAAQPLTSVTVSGTPRLGFTLTSALTPVGATATYQWERAAAVDGPYSAIPYATGSSYGLGNSSDANYYFRVVATGSGGYSGSVTTAPVGPVTP